MNTYLFFLTSLLVQYNQSSDNCQNTFLFINRYEKNKEVMTNHHFFIFILCTIQTAFTLFERITHVVNNTIKMIITATKPTQMEPVKPNTKYPAVAIEALISAYGN